LDILTKLGEICNSKKNREDDLGFFLRRWNESCGEVFGRHIGTNSEGWRSDWALCRLAQEWQGENGTWFLPGEMAELSHATGGVPVSFTGSNGIVSSSDPLSGYVCYKDGATTGATSGIVGQTEGVMFIKGTANHPEGDTPSDSIVKAKILILHPVTGPKPLCASGDSGSAIFYPIPEKDAWTWAGQLVSICHKHDRSIGFIVPQSQILRSLEDHTGRTWRLAG
jgi:hypothetical protein